MNTHPIKKLSLLLALFLVMSSHEWRTSSPSNPGSIEQLLIEFRADFGSLNRFYHIEGSPERRIRLMALYENYTGKLNTMDFAQLDPGGQVDYVLFERDLNEYIRALKIEEKESVVLDPWTGFGQALYNLEKSRRRGANLDWSLVAHEIALLNSKLEDLQATMDQEKPVFLPHLAKRADKILDGYTQAINSVLFFYTDYDHHFTWWLENPLKELRASIEIYSENLAQRVDSSLLPQDDGSGILGNPIGRDEIIRSLHAEFIPYNPEELIQIALKEFEWCDEEMLKVSKEMGFGKDWKAAQEQVKQSYVAEGLQPATMVKLYDESVAFLKEKDLLTIPSIAEETWRMSMISAAGQRVSPFFLGGEVLQIAYPTDDMSHEEKMMSMRGNNPHFARAVVHHELIAGHHLQQFMNQRYNTHRNYHSPFWTEGWALYWELLLWDLGFPQSAEDKVGMLFWRKHRCARIIFSLNYHLGKWTPQQCIDYLVDRVGHERANAEGEVRRSFTGRYGPLYQIAYMVGGLQFYALKEELVDSGKMTFKEYHDAVLHENNMPVEMLRAILINQSLSKNFESNWRFRD
jgi:uncharacterized protein (DUF885 family)